MKKGCLIFCIVSVLLFFVIPAIIGSFLPPDEESEAEYITRKTTVTKKPEYTGSFVYGNVIYQPETETEIQTTVTEPPYEWDGIYRVSQFNYPVGSILWGCENEEQMKRICRGAASYHWADIGEAQTISSADWYFCIENGYTEEEIYDALDNYSCDTVPGNFYRRDENGLYFWKGAFEDYSTSYVNVFFKDIPLTEEEKYVNAEACFFNYLGYETKVELIDGNLHCSKFVDGERID